MFQDEAGFGRINKPRYCWCKKGFRPSVSCHHVREYRYAYGAVEPLILILTQQLEINETLWYNKKG